MLISANSHWDINFPFDVICVTFRDCSEINRDWRTSDLFDDPIKQHEGIFVTFDCNDRDERKLKFFFRHMWLCCVH